MIQFQSAPATRKSENIKELVELDRAEERSRFEALRISREEARKKLEKELLSEESSAESLLGMAQTGTIHGIGTTVFGIIAFSLRSTLADAGYVGLSVAAIVAGSISLVLSLPLILGAVVGWQGKVQSVKRVRELKRQLERKSQ